MKNLTIARETTEQPLPGATWGSIGSEAAREIAKYAALVILTARSRDKFVISLSSIPSVGSTVNFSSTLNGV